MIPHDRKIRVFASLHAAARGFVMPNAWDAGSAAILADAGFPAIATTLRHSHISVAAGVVF